jgi:hypothetical protein
MSGNKEIFPEMPERPHVSIYSLPNLIDSAGQWYKNATIGAVVVAALVLLLLLAVGCYFLFTYLVQSHGTIHWPWEGQAHWHWNWQYEGQFKWPQYQR